jgi:carboxymethylenebutenolidase
MTLKGFDYVALSTPTGAMRTHLFRPAGEDRYAAILFYSEIFSRSQRRT